MKIYCVIAYDNAHSWHYFATRKQADAAARQMRAGYKDSEYPSATVEVEAVEVAPTRAGIAQALQDVIDQTCVPPSPRKRIEGWVMA